MTMNERIFCNQRSNTQSVVFRRMLNAIRCPASHMSSSASPTFLELQKDKLRHALQIRMMNYLLEHLHNIISYLCVGRDGQWRAVEHGIIVVKRCDLLLVVDEIARRMLLRDGSIRVVLYEQVRWGFILMHMMIYVAHTLGVSKKAASRSMCRRLRMMYVLKGRICDYGLQCGDNSTHGCQSHLGPSFFAMLQRCRVILAARSICDDEKRNNQLSKGVFYVCNSLTNVKLFIL